MESESERQRARVRQRARDRDRERDREREKASVNGCKFMQTAVYKCVAIVMYIKYICI